MYDIQKSIALIEKTKRNEIVELIFKQDTKDIPEQEWIEILETAAKAAGLSVNQLLAEVSLRSDYEKWLNENESDYDAWVEKQATEYAAMLDSAENYQTGCEPEDIY